MIEIKKTELKKTINKYINLFHNRPRKSLGLVTYFFDKFNKESLEMEMMGKSSFEGNLLVTYCISSNSGQNCDKIRIWIGKEPMSQKLHLLGIKRNCKEIETFISTDSYLNYINLFFNIHKFIEIDNEKVFGTVERYS